MLLRNEKHFKTQTINGNLFYNIHNRQYIMSSIHKQVTVPYTADQMYDLVYDINSYSKFIPLCSYAEVHEEQNQQSRATMKIAKGEIGFKFTTVNTMEKGRSISINLENGPFKSLKGVWRFTPLGTHRCSVSLHF
jgi:ribosome-associated toxin RatA of RatAB toxin-antitoxin module